MPSRRKHSRKVSRRKSTRRKSSRRKSFRESFKRAKDWTKNKISRAGSWVKDNKKKVGGGIGALGSLGLGYYAFKKLRKNNNQDNDVKSEDINVTPQFLVNKLRTCYEEANKKLTPDQSKLIDQIKQATSKEDLHTYLRKVNSTFDLEDLNNIPSNRIQKRCKENILEFIETLYSYKYN
jgi:hypothetical protein